MTDEDLTGEHFREVREHLAGTDRLQSWLAYGFFASAFFNLLLLLLAVKLQNDLVDETSRRKDAIEAHRATIRESSAYLKDLEARFVAFKSGKAP